MNILRKLNYNLIKEESWLLTGIQFSYKLCTISFHGTRFKKSNFTNKIFLTYIIKCFLTQEFPNWKRYL